MSKYLAESDIETAAIEWLLEDKRFRYHHGQDIQRNLKKTVLEQRFAAYLQKRYSHVPAKVLAEVQQEFLYQSGPDLHHRNHSFHLKLSKGISKNWTSPLQGGEQGETSNSKTAGGVKEHFEHFYAVDYDNPSNNEFWAVNQYTIEGRNTRRPDLIIFVNGLPLVLFEFKNWFDPEATVDTAFNQVQHYTEDIPLLFETNCLTVISDGDTTLHGMYSSGREWYAAWKSVDGINIVENDFALETLIKGLLTPERLLQYIRFYIFHEPEKGQLVKKGAKYHQYFGIQFALANTLKAIRPLGDGRIGVIWHTTRSGKSITMAIYTAILRQMKELKNPTVIVQVDRFDLNKQLYEDFVGAKDLVGDVQLAQSTEELRNLISGDGGGVIFSTIEKFRLINSPRKGGERDDAVTVSIKGGVKKLLDEGTHHINLSAFTRGGILKYNPKLKQTSNDLRYARNLPEVLLWNQLKRDALGVDFHRQKAIGSFVVDLFCPELMLAIEIDGKVHEEENVMQYDQRRQQELESYGIEFLRFSARDVFENMGWVVTEIETYVKKNRVEEKLSQVERAVYNKNRHLFNTPLEKSADPISRSSPLPGGIPETEHPVLSERDNIIVIADECHRTQYGLIKGFAANLRNALPNASFVGFTGTPVDSKDADTVGVFGDILHVYDIKQATEDNAVVPIYYEPRLAKLHLGNEAIEEEAEEITGGLSENERNKILWAAAEDAAGADDRVAAVARDILQHYIKRNTDLNGKAMIVCMSRRNCVKMYNAITALEGCPEVAVIMTSNIAKDPKDWSPHIRTKEQMEAVKARFKDPDDPLKLVIVRDMWLTGFDNPPMHTLYVDKIMSGHNLIQAINRVATVFRDKPSGLIVDYIGIGDRLRDATKKYTGSGGKGQVTIDIEEAFAMIKEEIALLKTLLPSADFYKDWPSLSTGDKLKRMKDAVNHVVAEEERSKHFLLAEKRMTGLATIVKSHAEVRTIATDIVFLQQLGTAVRKVKFPTTGIKQKEQQVKELIHRSIESEEVVDVFEMAGIERFDISIINDDFLATAKEKKSGTELKLELIRQILNDEIKVRHLKNLIKYRNLKEEVERIINDYHNHFFDSLVALEKLREVARDMQEEDVRRRQLGLTDEEEAFYEILAKHKTAVTDFELIKEIVKDITASIKKNLQIDWFKKPDARAQIMLSVRKVLQKKGVTAELKEILEEIMDQAEARYREWWGEENVA